MKRFKAILCDLNGTLIDIWTDENREDVYRTMAHLLGAYGVELSTESFRTLFYELMAAERRQSGANHPEFNVVGIFRTILRERGNLYTRQLPESTYSLLPEFLAQTFRAASMMRLVLFPEVRQVLDLLQREYRLAAVSDAQKIWAETELRRLDLIKFFPVRIISGEYGFRKPSPTLFQMALDRLDAGPDEVIFVGNDTYRDVCGAKRMGIKCVYFQSNQGDQRDHGCVPDYVIHRFSELPRAVGFLEDRQERI